MRIAGKPCLPPGHQAGTLPVSGENTVQVRPVHAQLPGGQARAWKPRGPSSGLSRDFYLGGMSHFCLLCGCARLRCWRRRKFGTKLELLQQKYSENRIFLERTDKLAAALRISLRDLAPRIELSVASLFGYRSGSLKISPKAWGKLERAEKSEQADGIGEKKPRDVFRSGDVKEFNPAIEKNLPVPQGVMATAKEVHDLRDTVSGLREQVARLERMMLRLLDAHQTDSERPRRDRTLDEL